MKGKKDWNAAATEAFEEAGVEGHIGKKSIGDYTYDKCKESGTMTPCKVIVYPFEVIAILGDWPEKRERRRKWFPAKTAAERVDDEGLKAVIEAALT